MLRAFSIPPPPPFQEKERLEDEAKKDVEAKHTQKLKNRTLKVCVWF